MLRAILTLTFLLVVPALAEDSNKIPTHRSIQVQVGQSIIVNGFRGACGARPKNVDPNRTRATRLGVLSNGKWGVVQSRTCGGWTPAVEVIFTAQKKGRETIEVAGTKIKVAVR
ncbi:MAG: hypothetical protein AAF214_07785 [Pseudomonadota bacterium]